MEIAGERYESPHSMLVESCCRKFFDVELIFSDLKGYSRNVDGRLERKNAAYEFVSALPSQCKIQDKHTFVAYQYGRPVGLLDVIDGHPGPGTAFIGLLAVREQLLGTGIGHALYQEAERFLRENLQAKTARLAVVESNPVSGFWQKMGFQPTGEVKLYEGEAIKSQSILMEKALLPAFE